MICLDTGYLIELWRHRADADHPAVKALSRFSDEAFVVPVHAAGEFLEGAAYVSEQRLREGREFLAMFRAGEMTSDTALLYATAVAALRRKDELAGVSTFDAWIAAWATQHGAAVLTTNERHFKRFAGVRVVSV